jgi:hypothetical protein
MPCCCKLKRDSGQVFKVYFKMARRTAGRVTVRKHFCQATGRFVTIRADLISTTLRLIAKQQVLMLMQEM